MKQGESGSRCLVDLSQNSAVVPPPVPGSDESSLKDPTKSPPSQEGSSDDALADILTKKGGDLHEKGKKGYGHEKDTIPRPPHPLFRASV